VIGDLRRDVIRSAELNHASAITRRRVLSGASFRRTLPHFSQDGSLRVGDEGIFRPKSGAGSLQGVFDESEALSSLWPGLTGFTRSSTMATGSSRSATKAA
jgi:hypothetical protein